MNPSDIRRGLIAHVIDDPAKPPVGSEIWPDRMAVIVSNDIINQNSRTVQIVYLTRSFSKKASPLHIEVTSCGKSAIALCEQVHTVDKSRLTTPFAGYVSEKELSDINAALMLSLGVSPSDNIKGLFTKWSRYIEKFHLEVAHEQAMLIREAGGADGLTKLIDNLRRERDSYKTLYDAAVQRLKSISALAS